jgi:hypothetical protein
VSEGFIERAAMGQIYVARLVPGDDLNGEIGRLADVKDERRILILSGAGSVKDIVLRNLTAGADLPISGEDWQSLEEPGPCEILSLTGNLFPMGGDPMLHIHATLGRADGSVIGGHLDAATVFSSVELFFIGIDRSWAVKNPDEETGLAELEIATERKPRL